VPQPGRQQLPDSCQGPGGRLGDVGTGRRRHGQRERDGDGLLVVEEQGR
jgi:hypothetical protein